jgi:hypothetical protein
MKSGLQKRKKSDAEQVFEINSAVFTKNNIVSKKAEPWRVMNGKTP